MQRDDCLVSLISTCLCVDEVKMGILYFENMQIEKLLLNQEQMEDFVHVLRK